MGITNGLLTLPVSPIYSGQIPDSFDYPFSIVLTSPYSSETGTAVITFYSSTNGAYHYYYASSGGGTKVNWTRYSGYSHKY